LYFGIGLQSPSSTTAPTPSDTKVLINTLVQWKRPLASGVMQL
jgi:hypothetical protein